MLYSISLKLFKITKYQNLFTGLAISHPKNEEDSFGFGDPSSNAAPYAVPFKSVRASPFIGFTPTSNNEQEMTGPTFNITTMKQRITAIKGKPVELSCNVIDLGNKTVRDKTKSCKSNKNIRKANSMYLKTERAKNAENSI